MARQLTKEAKDEILSNSTLYIDICKIMDVKPSSLPPLIYRNSPWLVNHDVVLKISETMKKSVDQILVESAKAATA